MKPSINPCDLEYTPINQSSEPFVRELLQKNYSAFNEAGSVIDATERRIPRMLDIYQQDGRCYFVARLSNQKETIVAGCGIGSLQGLPASEGIGEIRDLFVEEQFRGCGVGGHLLHLCLHFALSFGYKQIYLQTTPKMLEAQRLFKRFGFEPVEDKNTLQDSQEDNLTQMPCYFILSDLSRFTTPAPKVS